MPLTLKTRKPIDKLVAGDLVKFPIWEFALGEEGHPERDETWVRPVDAQVVKKGLYGLVAADYQTASGLELPGFAMVSTDDGVDIGPGALLVKGKYLVIHSSRTLRASLARGLGLKPKQVFPLKFVLRVPIGREKERRSGVVA